jgi:2'-5' RNA ligase
MNHTGTEEAKYFIAIVPPEPLFGALHDLKSHFREKYNARAALRSPPHITLHMPFLWNERKESRLVNALTEFAATRSPFGLRINHFGSFPPRVIFAAIEDSFVLTECQLSLHRFCKVNLNLFNANYQERPFHPHFTLAFRDLRKEAFAEAWNEFSHRTFQEEFTVDRLRLLKHNGKEWDIHVDLLFRS